MRTHKNFISKKEFNNIKSMLLGEFPWFYRDRLVKQPKDNEGYYFTHTFMLNNKINSDFYEPEIKPIVKKLNAKDIVEIRANLMMKRNDKYFSGYHIDNENIKTAIFYVNKNNGETLFKTGEKILPEENKMIIFDSNKYHGVFNQTDVKRRVVINFNYR